MSNKLQNLITRGRIIQQIRTFFIEKEFLEVETPHRIRANAPEPHIDAVASDGMWLHTSPELAMKRLLAAGCGDIFQLCRVWRDNEYGSRHLPEFTLLEWYRRDIDYSTLMTDCEDLLLTLVPEKGFSYRGERIDLNPPWRRLSVKEAFRLYAECSADEAVENDCFEEVLTGQVEPALGVNPVFLTEYPAPLAALARLKPGDSSISERCELYIGGLELANGFSELTDPEEQRRRFITDEEERRCHGKPPCPLPEDFLEDLHMMPEAAGIAFGVDRLVMLLTDAATIDEVVAFPPC